MKRLFSVFVSIAMFLSLVAFFGVGAQAEIYDNELWQEKRAYEIAKGYVAVGAENFIHRHYMDQPETTTIPVILYTEQGRSLKYEFVKSYDGGLDMVSDYLSGGYVGCNEILEIRYSCYNAGAYEWVGISMYRRVMQALGITSDELRQAYQTMKETPEVARELLPFLSDAQFEQFVEQTKQEEMPENFVIEAACMEDDDLGEALMCVPGSIYVLEWGGSVSMVELFSISCISNGMHVELFDSVDMTTEAFGCFIEDVKTAFKRRPHLFEDVESPDGRTAKEKLEYLESAREAQLAAAKTGDGAVSALWVIALALPALTVVAVKRKRRI